MQREHVVLQEYSGMRDEASAEFARGHAYVGHGTAIPAALGNISGVVQSAHAALGPAGTPGYTDGTAL